MRKLLPVFSGLIVCGCWPSEGRTLGRHQSIVVYGKVRGYATLNEMMSLEHLDEYTQRLDNDVLKEFRQRGAFTDFFGMSFVAAFPKAIPETVKASQEAIAIAMANIGVTKPDKLPLDIEIGVHLGEVYWGEYGSGRAKQQKVIGEHLVMAARLAGEASHHESVSVLVSQPYWNLLEEKDADAKSLGQLKFKRLPDDPITYYPLALPGD